MELERGSGAAAENFEGRREFEGALMREGEREGDTERERESARGGRRKQRVSAMRTQGVSRRCAGWGKTLFIRWLWIAHDIGRLQFLSTLRETKALHPTVVDCS